MDIDVGITRELDKESPLYCYSIYISYTWSMIQIITPALMSMHHPWGSHAFDMLLDVIHLVCSRPMTSHHVICHVTAVTCLFIVKEKGKINSKEKKRNIKSRKIDKRMLVLMCIMILLGFAQSDLEFHLHLETKKDNLILGHICFGNNHWLLLFKMWLWVQSSTEKETLKSYSRKQDKISSTTNSIAS